VSEHEAERFRKLTPDVADKIVCLRNGVDTDYFDPQRSCLRPDSTGRPFVAFTGAMDYWPNEDAVIWFATEVLPLARKDAPTLRFVIAGRDPSVRVRRLGARSDIEIVANPPDIRPYIAHAAAVVVPLRDSPGVANKVLEGLAMARPLVATPQAVADISAEPGRELLIAETPAEFALALSTVLQNLDVAKRLGAAARKRVLTDYRWATNLAQLPRLIEGDPATRRETPQTA
jgi:sugar transferase (PEP-CTERM/EpsH1 system associated)